MNAPLLIFFTAFSALIHFILGSMLTYHYPETYPLAPYIEVTFYKVENAQHSEKTQSADAVLEKAEPETEKNMGENEVKQKKTNKLAEHNKKANPASTNSIHSKIENKHIANEVPESMLPASTETVNQDKKKINGQEKNVKIKTTMKLGMQDNKSISVTPPKVTKSSWSEEEKRKYLEYIRKEIMSRIEYPFIAKRRGIEGEVWVTFTIKQDGSFKNISITKESPYSVLNDAVLKAIQNISVAKKPKEEIAVNIPITFTLK